MHKYTYTRRKRLLFFFSGPVAGRVRSRHAGKNARGLQRRRRGCREAGSTAEPSAVESAHVAVTFALLPNAHVAVTVLLIVVAVVVVEAGVPVAVAVAVAVVEAVKMKAGVVVRVLLVIVVAAVGVVI